ncbi:hypothetical protein BpHYR1_051840 [Brachionus plicatilis]|uniref:Uncharacterized protein n=1 Tax=Brachionus plicatilis TaxID=10195 RepID=A0A3M7T1T6_BRAPC|nr:hypothetical protein BpHYR1_051840 [Brachionus plicatilis]
MEEITIEAAIDAAGLVEILASANVTGETVEEWIDQLSKYTIESNSTELNTIANEAIKGFVIKNIGVDGEVRKLAFMIEANANLVGKTGDNSEEEYVDPTEDGEDIQDPKVEKMVSKKSTKELDAETLYKFAI